MLSTVMNRWIALLFVAQVLTWPAAAAAQGGAPAAPPPVPPDNIFPIPGIPGKPFEPRDRANNPHPTMPWVVTSPYGVVQRWIWMPPEPVVANEGVLYQPGFWVAQTTTGYHYPVRWVLKEVAPGSFSWVLLNGGAVPFAR
jgi:hypothetical protein